jgi:hypothetical protein
MRTLFAALVAILFAIPSMALASNLSIYPASVSLKKGDSVEFIVHLQSMDDINTLGATVVLPPNAAFLSAADGAVLTDWVQHPTFSATDQTVSFAGIMQNGWKGDGEAAIIKIAAKEDGVYSLQFKKDDTEIYKNDGQATPEPVVYGAAALPLWAPQGLALFGLILVVLILLGLWVRRKYKISFV